MTNLDLAPRPVMVDGLLAVPIDIRQIAATLTFDGATVSGAGDATIEFVVGPQSGNPIFDLRQTITAAWLDGTALPAGQLAHHDFRGRARADLRLLETGPAPEPAHTPRNPHTPCPTPGPTARPAPP